MRDRPFPARTTGPRPASVMPHGSCAHRASRRAFVAATVAIGVTTLLGTAAASLPPRQWSDDMTLRNDGPNDGPPRAFGTDDPAMTTRATRLLAAWDAFAHHRTGTLEDAATADWLAGLVREAGGEPTITPFPFRRRVPIEAWLEVGGERLHGRPAFDGGSTGPDGIDAQLRPIADASGIGVCNVTPNLNTPGSQALVAARRAQPTHSGVGRPPRHHALVCCTDPAFAARGIAPFNADDWHAPYGPPVLQLGAEHAAQLAAAAAAGTQARLVIHDQHEHTTASNVQAIVQGSDARLSPLVVMTPRSGWWVCTSERGGGLIAWLEALRSLAGAVPRRSVIFTANTGHELGHVGLDAFVHANPALPREATWLHLGANFAATGARVRLQAADAALRELALGHFARHTAVIDDETPVGTRPFGEARNIHDAGGRYASLLGSNPLFHHPDDRWPHAVDMPRMLSLVRAIVDLVRTLAA